MRFWATMKPPPDPPRQGFEEPMGFAIHTVTGEAYVCVSAFSRLVETKTDPFFDVALFQFHSFRTLVACLEACLKASALCFMQVIVRRA